MISSNWVISNSEVISHILRVPYSDNLSQSEFFHGRYGQGGQCKKPDRF